MKIQIIKRIGEPPIIVDFAANVLIMTDNGKPVGFASGNCGTIEIVHAGDPDFLPVLQQHGVSTNGLTVTDLKLTIAKPPAGAIKY